MIIDVIARQMDRPIDVLLALDAIVSDCLEENGDKLQEIAENVVDAFLEKHPECRGWELILVGNT